jgi:Amt family ammonium transporter
MMTIRALALLYCGVVRRKNVLSTMGQSFVAVALVSILWRPSDMTSLLPAMGPSSASCQGFSSPASG